MKILIMGAGAIGCFVGGSLAASGQTVTLVGRSSLMQKIAKDGLILQRPGRSPQVVWPEAVTCVPVASTFDVVFLTVKAPATSQAIGDLAGLQTYFVSLQNGIGNEEQVAAAFGPERVIAGTITIPIQAPELGVIEVSKAKGGLGLAPLHADQPITGLAETLKQAGLPTSVYDDYRAMKWSKLLLNIINNATSAILNQPPAQIIAQPALFNLEIRALQEGVAVMHAQGIQAVKLPSYPVNWLAWLASAPWLSMAAKRAILRPFMVSGRGSKMPSLYLDLAARRPTSEISVLNGAIVEWGRKVGVPTPVNQTLTDILSGLVAGRLDRADYQNQPERLMQEVKTRNG
jgi:2-dehydropantoate 2-reductase